MAGFYCDFAPGHEWHGPYHEAEYGFPLRGDAELFERLILEINQAGLSWLTILKKREAFRAAYREFDPAVVARFGARDVRRLMADAGIIRNRLKIEAAIANARTLLALRESHGSFAGWLDAHLAGDVKTPRRDAKAQRRKDAKRARTKQEWVDLFKHTFRFTGGEIVGEFRLSTGYLPGAHRKSCPAYSRVLAANPPFLVAPP
jgi:DNA-3-methyladenine glycosylase I